MTSTQEKKWRLVRARLGRHPIWCAWQVTYRCNYRCRFCPYWHDEMGKQPEQTVEQFEYGARKLGSWGTMLISLAGGEPFLRDDIVDVVEVVGKWHIPLITTNGSRADKHLARELYRAGLWGLSVSIDYAQAELHDQARGVQGAFERAVQSLEIFSQARQYPWQRVNIMCVLMDDNLDQVEPLIQLAAKYDANFMIQPYCQEKTGSTKYLQDGNNGVSGHLLSLRSKYPNFLSNPIFLQNFDVYLNGGVPNCGAGKAFFNIDSTGDIAICVERRERPSANLYRDDHVTIGRKLREDSRGNSCRDCWYNCRGEVESLYTLKGLWANLPILLGNQS